MHTMFSRKQQQCLTRYIELVKNIEWFGYLRFWRCIFVKNIYAWGKRSATICYCINKTQFVSFFVYRRQSRDRFRIDITFWRHFCNRHQHFDVVLSLNIYILTSSFYRQSYILTSVFVVIYLLMFFSVLHYCFDVLL